MKVNYSINKGASRIKTGFKKYIIGAAAAIGVIAALAAPSFAAQPTSPGCFGQDRAAYANEFGSLGHEPGGVGYYASLRAGENGTINQAYKTSCGGDPIQ